MKKLPQEEQESASSGGPSSSSSSSPTTTESAASASSAAPSEEPGPGSPAGQDSSASTSSAGPSSSSTAPSTNNPLSCTALSPDRECVVAAPTDWGGPVALIQGQREKDVWVCDAHSGDVDGLFDEVTAPPWECRGCKPRVRIPSLSAPELIRYLGTSCSADKESARFALEPSKCSPIEPTPSTGYAWGIQTPSAKGEVKCDASPITSSGPGREIVNHFRGCSVIREGQCSGANEVCVLKRSGLSCVYRSGDHECPATYSGSRKLLYGGVDDQRSCGKCEAVYEPGELKIQGKLSFFNNESCAPAYLVESLPFSALSGRCDSEQTRIDNSWLYVRYDVEESTQTGKCTTTGWAPQGGVKKTKPVTLCCRNPSGQ